MRRPDLKRDAVLWLATGLALVAAVLIFTISSSDDQRRSLDTAPVRAIPSAVQGNLSDAPSNQLKARVATAYARLPLHFEVNRGQTDAQVKFLTRGVGHTLFLTNTEAVLVLAEPSPTEKGARERPAPTTGIVLRMTFVGANPRSRVAGLDEFPGKANYFVGRDPTRWHTGVPLYARVRYHDLYPGIDLSYSGDQRHLESEFIVGPGADPSRILLGWRGADSLDVDAQGDLVLHTAIGTVRQGKPVIYQELDGVRREIAGRYVLKDAHRVGFQIAAYDEGESLVIGGSVPFSISPMR